MGIHSREVLLPSAWLAKLVGARDPLMHYWASLFPWVDFYRVIAGRMIWSVTRNKKIGNAQRAKGRTKNNLDGWSCSCSCAAAAVGW